MLLCIVLESLGYLLYLLLHLCVLLLYEWEVFHAKISCTVTLKQIWLISSMHVCIRGYLLRWVLEVLVAFILPRMCYITLETLALYIGNSWLFIQRCVCLGLGLLQGDLVHGCRRTRISIVLGFRQFAHCKFQWLLKALFRLGHLYVRDAWLNCLLRDHIDVLVILHAILVLDL